MRRRFINSMNLIEVQEKFVTSGTFIVPQGCRSIEVYVIGGGGGGGKTGHAGGAGGGGGQVVHQTISVSPGQIIPYVIGQGGVASSYGSTTFSYKKGTNGEDSYFGDIIAKGGDVGGSAYGMPDYYGGWGGINYTKGGNGGSDPDYDSQTSTSGIDGTFIDGEYYGSSGGAGSWGEESGTYGGANAGKGKTLFEIRIEHGITALDSEKAVDGFGGGGGASQPQYSQYGVRTGGSGAIIIKYKRL